MQYGVILQKNHSRMPKVEYETPVPNDTQKKNARRSQKAASSILKKPLWTVNFRNSLEQLNDHHFYIFQLWKVQQWTFLSTTCTILVQRRGIISNKIDELKWHDLTLFLSTSYFATPPTVINRFDFEFVSAPDRKNLINGRKVETENYTPNVCHTSPQGQKNRALSLSCL